MTDRPLSFFHRTCGDLSAVVRASLDVSVETVLELIRTFI